MKKKKRPYFIINSKIVALIAMTRKYFALIY